MPLIFITAHPEWLPADPRGADTPQQARVRAFGEALPELFSDNAQALHMNACPPEGVQVKYGLFGPSDLNTPKGIWVMVVFTEALEATIEVRTPRDERLRATGKNTWTRIKVRDELAEAEVKAKLKELLEPMFVRVNPDLERAVDVFWGLGHGWLKFGPIEIDW